MAEQILLEGGGRLANAVGRGVGRMLSQMKSNHCRHCQGNDSECSCSKGCKTKKQSACSATWAHCWHCRGLAGYYCECVHNCITPHKVECHHNITCDRCNLAGIDGSLYKCRHCEDYDLCQTCYDLGEHQMHAFMHLAWPGAQPKALPAKDPSYDHAHKGALCDNCKHDPIVGSRFKCTVCPDYDLCGKCYDAKAHVHHGFIRYSHVGSAGQPMEPRQLPVEGTDCEFECPFHHRTHILVVPVLEAGYAWTCSYCLAEKTPGSLLYHCSVCNWGVCAGTCSKERIDAIKCPSNHIASTIRIPHDGCTCDKCQRVMMTGEKQYYCSHCDWGVCIGSCS
jgi:hypothetical protein